MTRFRPPQKARRDSNEPGIVNALRAMGFKVEREGPFDLIICRGKHVWLGEVKDPKKRGHADEFTKAQIRLIDDGWPVYIFRETADAASFAHERFEEARAAQMVPLVGNIGGQDR